jgi:hypothetical protein
MTICTCRSCCMAVFCTVSVSESKTETPRIIVSRKPSSMSRAALFEAVTVSFGCTRRLQRCPGNPGQGAMASFDAFWHG